MIRTMVLTTLLMALVPVSSAGATARQLNIDGFVACLNQVERRVDLATIKSRYDLGTTDLLLLYLGLYSGKRLPMAWGAPQWLAHKRWAESFEEIEAKTAAALSIETEARSKAGTLLYPSDIFNMAITSCEDAKKRDSFCAALVAHNVLRTLGRSAQAVGAGATYGIVEENYNPAWYRLYEGYWSKRATDIVKLLSPLRNDGGGDRWGEWYHFFGVATFTLREAALGHDLEESMKIVRLNRKLNPILGSGKMSEAKAQVDVDSVEISYDYATNPARDRLFLIDCQVQSSYVTGKPPLH